MLLFVKSKICVGVGRDKFWQQKSQNILDIFFD